MAYVRRRLVERKLKEMLLRRAREAGMEPAQLASWLYEAAGIRAQPSWRDLERKILYNDDVTAQELAAYLLSEGIKVDEKEWIRVVKSHSVGIEVPRLPSGEEDV
ncbi:hypothetical protein CF15_05850 [Pyrodictium occultum]|uniref:Uncharacterized protein n=1 Tax=Pyrodictium occultum TaxID=2309 RepID=A0A0V8RW44_PYROC|nr:hypothetical protein [Pyrodictium occultum]KSW12271.1 hypothetical protein CF15_05850 [Pyrodictium occultum]